MEENDSNCARVYDRNIAELPLTVELYGKYARVVDFSDPPLDKEGIDEITGLVSRFLYVDKANVIFKERKKREKREQYEKEDETFEVNVIENGLSFLCELKKYQDTGLFLDQAKTRFLIMENAENKKVLNLFSYTASFSVYAAKGGAESVTSVDLSNVYSSWARKNLKNNGFLDEKKYNVITEDAKVFLKKAVESRERYDIVIFDPPVFSNSHKAETFDVQKNYLFFLQMINMILTDGGWVVFSENLSGFSFDKKQVETGFAVREITEDIRAFGFSKKIKGLRVWSLIKKGNMRLSGGKRKMNDFENEERLTLFENDERELERKESRRDRKGPRAFSKDDMNNEGDYNFWEEESSPVSYRTTDKERTKSNRKYTDQKVSNPRSGSSRNDRRSFNEGKRDSLRALRPGEREGRYPKPTSRNSFSKMNDRYDENRNLRGITERRYPRYPDRPSRYEDERRISRYSDEMARPRERNFKERSGYQEEGPSRYKDDRRFSRYSDEMAQIRERDFRKQSGERTERQKERYDGENETSRFYKKDRVSRREEGEKKKTKPKPFGYDSFMSTKNRESATAYWLGQQEGRIDNTDDN